MLEFIVSVISLIFTITFLQTFGMYAIWFYDRRNFVADTEVPGDNTEVRFMPAIGTMLLEWLAITFLVVSYPVRLWFDASPTRSRQEGQMPVILVHGYGGTSANFLLLQWALKKHGWNNVYAVSYTPPTIDARKLAQQVANHINRILDITGADKAQIICHSMGGPLTRYAMHHLGISDKIERVITLGSPHQGSRIAALFPELGAAFQMRYRSDFLQQLNALPETPGDVPFYSLYSNLDNFVLPVSSSVLGGNTKNIHVPYHGHCMLLYSPKVLAHIERCLIDQTANASPQDKDHDQDHE